MLAQNFKTAEDLKITNDEWSAAISVLGMLERDEIKHQPPKKSLFDDWEHQTAIAPLAFNMGCSGVETSCGTIACIGGWMAHLMGIKGWDIRYYVKFKHSPSLTGLFWNNIEYETTPEQAAMAVRSFLTTGDARWDLAVSPQDTGS